MDALHRMLVICSGFPAPRVQPEHSHAYPLHRLVPVITRTQIPDEVPAHVEVTPFDSTVLASSWHG